MKIGTEKFKFNPYMVRDSPKYTIIDYKDILKVPQLVLRTLNVRTATPLKNIGMISCRPDKDNILERFKVHSLGYSTKPNLHVWRAYDRHRN